MLGVEKKGRQMPIISRLSNTSLRMVELPTLPLTMALYKVWIMCCLRPCHPHLHSFPERSHIFLWQGTLKISVKGPDSHVHEHMGSETRVHITSSAVLRTVQSVTLSIAQGPLLLCTFADLKFSISPGDCELPPASFHLSIWLHLLPIFPYLLKINDLLLAAFLDLQHYYSVIIFTCIFCYLNVFPHSSALNTIY